MTKIRKSWKCIRGCCRIVKVENRDKHRNQLIQAVLKGNCIQRKRRRFSSLKYRIVKELICSFIAVLWKRSSVIYKSTQSNLSSNCKKPKNITTKYSNNKQNRKKMRSKPPKTIHYNYFLNCKCLQQSLNMISGSVHSN